MINKMENVGVILRFEAYQMKGKLNSNIMENMPGKLRKILYHRSSFRNSIFQIHLGNEISTKINLDFKYNICWKI